MLLNPSQAQDALERFPIERRQKIIAAAPPETRNQWIRNEGYPETSIGHMMEPALAVFQPGTTVADATRELRQLLAEMSVKQTAGGKETPALRSIVANTILVAGSALFILILFLLSFTILPSWKLLVAQALIVVASAILLRRSFVRLYSKAEYALKETLSQPPAPPVSSPPTLCRPFCATPN
jgi:hypothetical protein